MSSDCTDYGHAEDDGTLALVAAVKRGQGSAASRNERPHKVGRLTADRVVIEHPPRFVGPGKDKYARRLPDPPRGFTTGVIKPGPFPPTQPLVRHPLPSAVPTPQPCAEPMLVDLMDECAELAPKPQAEKKSATAKTTSATKTVKGKPMGAKGPTATCGSRSAVAKTVVTNRTQGKDKATPAYTYEYTLSATEMDLIKDAAKLLLVATSPEKLLAMPMVLAGFKSRFGTRRRVVKAINGVQVATINIDDDLTGVTGHGNDREQQFTAKDLDVLFMLRAQLEEGLEDSRDASSSDSDDDDFYVDCKENHGDSSKCYADDGEYGEPVVVAASSVGLPVRPMKATSSSKWIRVVVGQVDTMALVDGSAEANIVDAAVARAAGMVVQTTTQ
ncbi:hypothetical protein GGF31_002422 [Allomyces arbusculus]|nr:hypothetical protein GGF31_002422 [Allomyces arbusculus]